jgi:ATP-dependent DNA helicase RecQ
LARYGAGQRIGAAHLIDVRCGKAGEPGAKWSTDELTAVGVGADLDEATWRGVLRQLVARGLALSMTRTGVLKPGAASRAVLGERSVEVRRLVADHAPSKTFSQTAQGAGSRLRRAR